MYELPEVSINVVNASGDIECSMEGYYNSGCTWTNSYTPFFLERHYTSEHKFYYDPGLSQEITSASGAIDDEQIINNGAVFVKYTLSPDWGTLDKTPNTMKMKPSPDVTEKKINWYAIRSQTGNADSYFFSMNSEDKGSATCKAPTALRLPQQPTMPATQRTAARSGPSSARPTA